MPEINRQKITFGEMRASGVRAIRRLVELGLKAKN
jgi:hypothetical protein